MCINPLLTEDREWARGLRLRQTTMISYIHDCMKLVENKQNWDVQSYNVHFLIEGIYIIHFID